MTVGVTIDYAVAAVVDVTAGRTEQEVDREISMQLLHPRRRRRLCRRRRRLQ
ncbi:hypothetical protein ACQPZP_33810 [Spirillospora sp. CA-142024]|uniref:hypothetical protein n=1 Tax=Spirillospora sp. CA-142024 TaxID=3240036 RepID=UPI003D935043